MATRREDPPVSAGAHTPILVKRSIDLCRGGSAHGSGVRGVVSAAGIAVSGASTGRGRAPRPSPPRALDLVAVTTCWICCTRASSIRRRRRSMPPYSTRVPICAPRGRCIAFSMPRTKSKSGATRSGARTTRRPSCWRRAPTKSGAGTLRSDARIFGHPPCLIPFQRRETYRRCGEALRPPSSTMSSAVRFSPSGPSLQSRYESPCH